VAAASAGHDHGERADDTQQAPGRDLTISMQPNLERCGSHRPTVMPGTTYR
jgi:hypothetical protein